MAMWHVDRVVQDIVQPALGLWYFTLKLIDLTAPNDPPRYFATTYDPSAPDACQLLNGAQDWLGASAGEVDWTADCPM